MMAVRQGTIQNRRDASVTVSFAGLERTIAIMLNFKKALSAAIKRAVTMSSRRITNDARARVPQRKRFTRYNNKRVPYYGQTGTLKKSIGFKVTKPRYASSSPLAPLIWVGVIGPRKGRKYSGVAFKAYHKPKRKSIAQRNVLVPVIPKYYSHLIEHGHTLKIWGSGKTKRIPARPFLKPALLANQGTILQMTRESLDIQIDKLIKKGDIIVDTAEVAG